MNDRTAHSGSSTPRPIDTDTAADDSTTEAILSRFDDGSDSVVFGIVEAVAAATDSELDAMSPLYETVDPEALTELVTSARDRPIDVSFSYEGCLVTISNDGRVVVEPPEN